MNGEPSSSDPDNVISTTDARMVLEAIDRAFEHVLRGRCRASMSLSQIDAHGLGPATLLRAGCAGTAHLLLAYDRLLADDSASGVEGASVRLPGCVIGSVAISASGGASGGAATISVSVETELVDKHDANEADGNPLAGGVDLRETNETGRRTVLVVRSGDHVEMVRRAGVDRARGVVPPMGRHRVRAALGLGGGSHRVALGAVTARPLAGPLLARLGEAIGASPARSRIGRVTLGLVS